MGQENRPLVPCKMGWYKMINIDYIMDLLDWDNSPADQNSGLELAKDIKCINVFIQPGSPYGKRIWDNCAKVLSGKSDKILEPYLIELLEWLQDMNWPGAYCVFDRLRQFADYHVIDTSINICVVKALKLGDQVWEHNLNMLRKDIKDRKTD